MDQNHDEKRLSEALRNAPGQIQVPLFPGFMRPHGFLTPDRGCHGLFYYYLCAMRNYEHEDGRVVYEGDMDPIVKYRNLFTSLCALYGVPSEQMCRYWEEVDAQAEFMGLPLLPDKEEYRFNTSSIILLN